MILFLNKRKLKPSWRDTVILLQQFRWPLIVFCGAVLGGGILYYLLGKHALEPVDNHVESVYLVMALVFLQPIGEFPDNWYLQ